MYLCMSIFMIYDCLFVIVCSMSKLRGYERSLCFVFSVFKQEKPLFDVHSSEVNKAKSKWKALLARLSHNPHISAASVVQDGQFETLALM